MAYTCEIKEQPRQPVLSIRARSAVQNLPMILGQSYGAIAQYLGELGEFPAGPPFVAYYNEDMQNLDIEVGFPVAKPLPGKERIQASEIAPGRFATCLHTGPYQDCAAAYTALMQWTQEQKHETTGISYEFYLNDPAVTPPHELQTQIMLPVKNP